MTGFGLKGFEPLLRGVDLDGAVVICEAPDSPERDKFCWQFVKEGLAGEEKVLIVLANVPPDEMKSGMKEIGVAFDEEVGKGRIVFLNWTEIAKADKIAGTLRLPSLIAAKSAGSGAGAKARTLVVGLQHLLSSLPDDLRMKFVSDMVGQIRAGVTLGMAVMDVGDLPEETLEELREPFDGVLRMSRDSLGEGLMIGVASFDEVEPTGISLPLGKLGDELVAGLAAMKGKDAEACPECGFQVLPGFDICPRCKAELKKPQAAGKEGPGSVFDYLEKLRIQGGVREPMDKADKEEDSRRKQLEEFLKSMGVHGEEDQTHAKERLMALAQSRTAPRRVPRAPGRTNGLTNGLKRGPGLVNGLAKGAGHVNGLSRTTGKVNGTGKTNGLVNGLRKARTGMTNGLTNGSGFTNGLGSKRFQRQTEYSRWKLFIVPMIAAILLITPVMMPEALFRDVHVMESDGSFGEWSGAIGLDRDMSIDASVDLVRGSVKSEDGRLGVYFEVAGTILTGDSSGLSSDIFEAYFDADSDANTGYSVEGIGADYLMQVFGQGHTVLRSGLLTWSQRSSQSSNDWSNWEIGGSVNAMPGTGTDSGKMEAMVDMPGEAGDAAHLASGRVLLHAAGWNNQEDYSDFTLSSTKPSLEVVQTSVAPQNTNPGTVTLLELSFRSAGGAVSVQGVSYQVRGTAAVGDISTFTARDEAGSVLGSFTYGGGTGQMTFATPLLIDGGRKNVTIEAAVTSSDGATLGLALADADSIVAPGASVSLFEGQSTREVAYLGSIPTGVVIDGAFSEWAGANTDAIGEQSTKGAKSVDLTGYDAHREGSLVSFYARVDGKIMKGISAPVQLPGRQQAPPALDSDRDSVPDSVEAAINDILPFDFDNDNVSDSMTNHDVDGDGVQDWPWGQDRWLNTTIPDWYGPPYAGRVVSDYIGPMAIPPPDFGEDKLRVFVDTDGVPNSGYWVKGIYADRMVDITGKNGRAISQEQWRFTGATPFTWQWAEVGQTSLAMGGSELEAQIDIAGLPPTANVTVVFDLRDWRGNYDDTSPARTRSMTRSADGGVSIERELYTAIFPESLSDGEIIFRDSQGFGLQWRLTGAKMIHGQSELGSYPVGPFSLTTSGFGLSYETPAMDISVGYSFDADRLKEEIILSSPPSFLVDGADTMAFDFAVAYLGGIAPELAGSIGSWSPDGSGSAYRFTTSGELEFHMGQVPAFTLAAPFAVDAGGSRTQCTYSLVDRVEQPDLRIGCPVDWLASASYPVTIDPTILMNGYRGENFGYSLATGDFNGDGKADLLVGAPYNNLGGSGSGRAYVYLGGATMDNVVDLEMPGPSPGGHFGWSVAAGDLNNDGYSDMIIGAPDYNGGDGRVYVNFGASTLDSVIDGVLVSKQAGEKFGYSLAVGNFNGDSYKDLIVGAPLNDTGGGDVGSAYIYFGGASFDTDSDKALHGANGGETFGWAVGVGDFNGDGYDDAAVGAPEYLAGGPAHPADGRVGIFFGGADMDTTQDVNCNNGDGNEEIGTSVTSGKYNADGYDDLYAGAPYFGNPNNNGRVDIYYGGSPMNGVMDASFASPSNLAYFGQSLARGKIGSAGLPEVAVGAQLYKQGIAPLERGRFDLFWNGTSGSFVSRVGDNDYDHFGYALAIGDVNSNSTFGELIVGAIDFDVVDSTNSGKVYIFNGENPGTFDTNPDVQILSKDPGSRAAEMLGYSVTTGDFNGDGRMDVLAGAPGNAYGGTANTGAAFIYFGKPFVDGYYGPDLMLPGQYGGEMFGWNVSAGDVNADGIDDAIIGAPYNDEGGADIGRAYVFYGGSTMNTVVDVDIAGQSAGELFGWDVASGNVNGDQSGGRPLKDIVVGAPQNGTGKGRAYIYFGSTSLASLISTPNVKLYRGDTEAFGSSLAIGNFNQDAYDDIFVGAPTNSSSKGAAYIYYGCSNWGNCFRDPDTSFYYTAYVSQKNNPGDTTGDYLVDAQTDNANDAIPPNGGIAQDGSYQVDKGKVMWFDQTYIAGMPSYGAVVGAWLRVQYSVVAGYGGTNSLEWMYSGAGWANTNITPANGDLGKYGWYELFNAYGVNTRAKVGSVQTRFTNNDGGASQAVDWDYDWVYVALRGQQPANVTLAGQVNTERFGHAVETGDLDGDSPYLDDAVVGAPFYSDTNDTGAAYIYSGSTIRATAYGGTISTPTKKLYGPFTTNGKFGWSLATGNVNGDAYDDLMVGAPTNNSNMGAVYWYYGPTSSIRWRFSSDGELNERRGWSIAAGDLVSLYYVETAMGCPYWDGSTKDGRVYILTPIPEFSDFLLPMIASLLVTLALGRRRLGRKRRA
jgi:KaiC/GvpD/RAD55 family RecA-like ATPase